MLVRLIYSSFAADSLNDEDLQAILLRAQEKNKTKRITGVLVYVNGCFTQILEGQKPDVESLVAQIRRDFRHHDLQVINVREIQKRAFADWSMSLILPDGRLPQWQGLRSVAEVREILEPGAEAEDALVRACLKLLDQSNKPA
ncbi:hypothetical protein JCM17960_08260 [Magnetospira thiophila]